MKNQRPPFRFTTKLTLLLCLLTSTTWAQWPVGMQLSSMKGSPSPQAMMAQLRTWGVTELEGGWPRSTPLKRKP